MYIYNTTFIIHPSEQQNFLAWMRSAALPALVNESLPARNPRLTVIAEVPGDSEMTSQSTSYAFQVEFKALEDAKKWADVALAPVAGDFAARFHADQNRAVWFATILQSIDL